MVRSIVSGATHPSVMALFTYMYELTNGVDDDDDGKWQHINGCS